VPTSTIPPPNLIFVIINSERSADTIIITLKAQCDLICVESAIKFQQTHQPRPMLVCENCC